MSRGSHKPSRRTAPLARTDVESLVYRWGCVTVTSESSIECTCSSILGSGFDVMYAFQHLVKHLVNQSCFICIGW